jgi:hypothetical protein
VPTTHTDGADELTLYHHRKTSTEDDEAIDGVGGSDRQGRVILDEVEPSARRDSESGHRIGLVFRELHGDQRCAVRSSQTLRDPSLVGEDHREHLVEFAGLGTAASTNFNVGALLMPFLLNDIASVMWSSFHPSRSLSTLVD